MRGFDRDLIRGKHYGQRSCEPHLKAEHMAAPTKSATRRFFLPTRSRPHMAHSGHSLRCNAMSAFGGKADIDLRCRMLMTRSGHSLPKFAVMHNRSGGVVGFKRRP